jgi:sugar fermentation stimulation protein A
VPNSGRLSELFVPGAPVWVSPVPAPDRKTPYDLRLVAHAGVFVSVDARLPASLLAEAWGKGELPGFAGYETLEREVRVGDSRLDLRLWSAGEPCWIEAKSVTLVNPGLTVQPVLCRTGTGDRQRLALFPDAPTSRGARHLEELIRLRRNGHRAAAIFVVQRPDATSFAPHTMADPVFAHALRAAAAAGVEVLAVTCRVSLTEIVLDRAIPVRLADQQERP